MTPPIHALHGCQGDKGRLQAEVEAKDAEIDRQQREIETLKVRHSLPCMKTCIMITPIRALVVRRTKEGCMQAEVEAKDGQIQQQGTELEEGVIQLNRQQRELQTLRVRNGYSTVQISNDSIHVRRTEEGCRQRWRLRTLKLSSSKERSRH